MVFSCLTAVAPLDRTATRPHAHPLTLTHDDRDAMWKRDDFPHGISPSARPVVKKSRRTSPQATDAKPKKLSTERSRLCRQRQKQYAESLELAVAALRTEVTDLVTLRDLRREQLVHTPVSHSGSLARMVREYCAIFQFGLTPEAQSAALAGRKHSLMATQYTSQQQCDFLYSMMDPDVQVFDWIGRTKRGPEPLVNGWKAWSAWHDDLTFRLDGVDVIEVGTADERTVAVSTRGFLCVRVNRRTIQQLFPHIAGDAALCDRLLGAEIRYPLRDTFYFTPEGRVGKYTVDIDFVQALNEVLHDFTKVAHLVAPPNDASLNDRAIGLDERCAMLACPRRDARLDVQYLLS